MDTKFVKLISGEILITEVHDSGEGETILINPLQPVDERDAMPYLYGFMEMNELQDNEVSMKTSHIMHIIDARPDIHEKYQQAIANKRGTQPIAVSESQIILK